MVNTMRGGESVPRVYQAGTLRYTLRGLGVLMFWLLWGDFIFTFMESVLPLLLPLLLKSHGAHDSEIAVIVTTIYMAMNALLNPIISYRSDRFRSRWGRRRPFIFVTTPFVVLFLSAIPFAPEILRGLESVGWIRSLLANGPVAPVILVFGLLVAGFQIFNMFISSVYYYLIPDVVPKDHLGRFYAMFRVVGTLAGVIFNHYFFGLAESHMREIFVGSALAYGALILLMCAMVKEGEYPPVTDVQKGTWWEGIRNYARECFGHRYYWLVFLAYSTWTWSTLSNVFSVFFYRDQLGLSLDFIGNIASWSGIIFIVLAYPFGVLVDRWNCHRALILIATLIAVLSLCTFWFGTDGRSAFFWSLPRNVAVLLSGLALLKWTVDVYPADRYGQFGSAGALFSSLGGIVLGPVCGRLMEALSDYRYFLIWNVIFSVAGLGATWMVYTRWKGRGGPDRYRAP